MRAVGFISLIILSFSASGCATNVPSLSLGSEARQLEPTEKPLLSATASEEPVRTAQASSSSDKSMLDNIWDNFSSAFKSGEEPAVKNNASGGSQQPSLKPGPLETLDPQKALALLNTYRASKGLKPLALDPRATKAAALLAADMAKHDHMSHFGPNGADVAKRLLTAGYNYRLAAENVGVGQLSAEEMIEGWKNSPKHNKNILLPDATDIGIAVQHRDNARYKTYWVLVLAAPG